MKRNRSGMYNICRACGGAYAKACKTCATREAVGRRPKKLNYAAMVKRRMEILERFKAGESMASIDRTMKIGRGKASETIRRHMCKQQ